MESETLIRDILSIKETLAVIARNNIPFIHVIAECDTTPGLFGIGKGSPLKMLGKNPHFRINAEIYNKDNATSKDIIES